MATQNVQDVTSAADRLKLALARWPLAGAVALARACTGNSKDQALLMPLLRSVLTEAWNRL